MSAANGPSLFSNVPLKKNDLCPEQLLLEQEAAFQRDINRLLSYKNEFVRVRCPACDSADASFCFEKYQFDYERCSACKTIFMNPRPSAIHLASYYESSENYRFWATHIFPQSEEARREKLHRPRLERILYYCDRFAVPRGTLVEIGAGFGTFAGLVRTSGSFQRVVCVEPTPEMANSCRERDLEVIEERIEEVDWSERQADVVVAYEVLEHLFEPREFIKACRRILKSDGILVLTCPNGRGFDIEMLGPLSQAIDAEHVNLLNPQSLSYLLVACDFEVLEVATPGRLDVEIVRDCVLSGQYSLEHNPFFQRILIEEWEERGVAFQNFLAAECLSSHMWVVARRTAC